MLKRRWIWIVVAVVVVLAGVGGVLLWRQSTAARAGAATRTVAVRKGTLQVTVSASGSLEPVRQVDLGFDVSGKVAEVSVDIGDRVKAGQVLARLDTTSLELSLRQAEAQLKSAQAQLAKAQQPATEETLKAAEASYYSALAQYQNLKNSPSPESLASAKAQLEKAKVALERAQAAYDRVSWRPDISARPESLQLQDATIDYQVALANYEAAAKGPSQEELAAAWRNVESAKAKLESLRNGPTEEDLASAEAAVEQAQIALETARRNLEAAVLKAPFDGVVAAMNLVVGEPAVSPAVTLMDLSRFRITVNVDEVDVSQLEVGMPAVVTVDALPDVTLTGKVERIGVAATSTGGAVYYPVVIALDPTDAPCGPECRPASPSGSGN
jgi:multidrug efflux pump subunit AcrA (membrane-fusion protein)